MFAVLFFFLAKYQGRNHFQIKKRKQKSNKILMITKR